MRVSRPSGEAVIVAKRRRLRDSEILIDRDIAMLADQCRGVRIPDIARKWKVTRGYVYRRLARMPEKVKEYLRKRMSALLDDSGIFLDVASSDRKAIVRIIKAEEKRAEAATLSGQETEAIHLAN